MTDHEQLVEKVAEAMWGERKDWNGKPVPWRTSGDVWDGDRRMTRNDARAAIAAIYEAMREPSGTTIEAGAVIVAGLNGSGCYALPGCQAASNKCGCEMDAADAWQAMLEASPLKGE